MATKKKKEPTEKTIGGAAITSSPKTYSIQKWTPALIDIAEVQADLGNLSYAAQLVEYLLTDGKVYSLLQTRVGTFLGLPTIFEEEDMPEIADDFYPVMCNEGEWRRVITTGILLGVAPYEISWEISRDGKREIPRIHAKDPRHLRYDFNLNSWFLKIAAENGIGYEEIEITPGDGRWGLFMPGGREKPWNHGIWKALTRWSNIKLQSIRDWALHGEKHGNAITVLKTPKLEPDSGIAPLSEPERQVIANKLANMGRNASMVTPAGCELDLVESTARTFETFKELISEANNETAMAILGQNLTSEATSGTGNSAAVHMDVAFAIIALDNESWSTEYHTNVLIPYAKINKGSSAKAPWVKRDTDGPRARQERAAEIMTLSQGVSTIVTSGIMSVDEARARYFSLGPKEINADNQN